MWLKQFVDIWKLSFEETFEVFFQKHEKTWRSCHTIAALQFDGN